jgi:antibiotic biosynthesis monooxygenase (ABM) superfamily enzyme
MARSNNFSNEPVTAVFSWRVAHGNEKIFEHMMHDIHKVARTFPGHMGVTTIKSPSDKESYQTVLRFDTTMHLTEWLSSDIRQKMMKPLEKYANLDTAGKSTGLETWFVVPGLRSTAPPRWKMALTTFIAIYPISLLYTLYLTPHIVDWPAAVRALVLPIIAPIILTYLFMPFLTQLVLKRWLYKNS